ncbi:MAG: hypothetical protein R2681_03790 [Pyrinomonadaceae bacterium]
MIGIRIAVLLAVLGTYLILKVVDLVIGLRVSEVKRSRDSSYAARSLMTHRCSLSAHHRQVCRWWFGDPQIMGNDLAFDAK